MITDYDRRKEWGYLPVKDRGCAHGPTGGLRAVWPMLKKMFRQKKNLYPEETRLYTADAVVWYRHPSGQPT